MTRHQPRRDERGFASLAAVGFTAFVAVAALAVAVLGSAYEASHRAAAAGDLPALAGAQAQQQLDDACAAAARIAAGYAGRLVSCTVEESGVSVEVAVATVETFGVRAVPEVVRAARAGPDPADGLG